MQVRSNFDNNNFDLIFDLCLHIVIAYLIETLIMKNLLSLVIIILLS